MDIDCVGSEVHSACMSVYERYPEIAFFMTCQSIDPLELRPLSGGYFNAQGVYGWLHSDDIEQEMQRFFHAASLEGIDVLYVFGVGLGVLYRTLKPWLEQSSSRKIIFLEDDIGVIGTLVHTLDGKDLLLDPQVHLQWIQDPKQWLSVFDELIDSFFSPHVEMVALESYARSRAPLFHKLRLQLMRQSAVIDALMKDALYSHQLVDNVLMNISQWPFSFFANRLRHQFKNIPAIICGAGPSLDQSLVDLKEIEDRALIIAGGSAITALAHHGIVPHLGLAIDPNVDEYHRLRVMSAFEMPLLYGTRVQPDVFNLCNGPRGYIRSCTGGPCETYFEGRVGIDAKPIGPDLGTEAFSVTTLAVALAVEMGCNPIILNGVDLAYTGMQRYAAGVMPISGVLLQDLQKGKQASERLLKRKSIHGNMVHTQVKWVMESNCIAQYAKSHKEVQFINASSNGLGFKGIENCSLQEVIASHLQHSLDLRAKIHQKMMHSQLNTVGSTDIQKIKEEMRCSLKKLLQITLLMLEELEHLKQKGGKIDQAFPSGKMTVLQMDFEEEIAFHCFFSHVGVALDRLLTRLYPMTFDMDASAKHDKKIDYLMAKWKQLHMMVNHLSCARGLFN